TSTAIPDPSFFFVGWFDESGRLVGKKSPENNTVYVEGTTIHIDSNLPAYDSYHNKVFTAKYVRAILKERDNRATPRLVTVGKGDDATLMLTADRDHRADLFQFGSVIAWDVVKDVRVSGHVVYNPTNLACKYWDEDWCVGESFPENTAENLKQGKGDPCRLIGFTAAQVRNLANAGETVDNGAWRIAWVPENREIVKNRSSYRFWGFYFGPGATKDGDGGEFFSSQEVFRNTSGMIVGTDGASMWTDDAYKDDDSDEYDGLALTFGRRFFEEFIDVDDCLDQRQALPIRCVRQK
ncbi:MAG: hypothetical protein ACRCZZ_00650, partial [Phocaeicola sp.]